LLKTITRSVKLQTQVNLIFQLPPPCARCLRTKPSSMAVLSRIKGQSLREYAPPVPLRVPQGHQRHRPARQSLVRRAGCHRQVFAYELRPCTPHRQKGLSLTEYREHRVCLLKNKLGTLFPSLKSTHAVRRTRPSGRGLMWSFVEGRNELAYYSLQGCSTYTFEGLALCDTVMSVRDTLP
jgi:hypothetical protein